MEVIILEYTLYKYTTATKTLRDAEQEHLLQHFPVVVEEKYRYRIKITSTAQKILAACFHNPQYVNKLFYSYSTLY